MDTSLAKSQLLKAGYAVKTCSAYHLQVKNKGGDIIINVWPTANKILRDYTPGPAKKFPGNEVLPAVAKLLRRTLKDQAADLRKLYPIIGDPVAQAMVYEWREGGLVWLKGEFNL